MRASHLSILKSFEDKSILVVGGTGFISKVWLSFVLEYLPQMKKIYVLVRSQKNTTGELRFCQLYSASPVFERLRHQYGSHIHNIPILQVVSGDASCERHLGLENAVYKNLKENLDLVINFAADLRFIAPLDEILRNNTQTAINIAKFVKSTRKAKLLHLSTCYVAGMSDGFVQEKLQTNYSPNGTAFCAQEEVSFALQEAACARSRDADYAELKTLGTARAQHLGWPNTYTYTKALGEILLSDILNQNQLCVFRPSIVESAENYPFAGWNEDFNGTAPFVSLLSSRYRFLVAKPHHYLDIIPVDCVAKGLVIAAAALLSGTHSQVYQSATSSLNPLSVQLATEFIFNYYKKRQKKSISTYIFPHFKPQFITPDHIFSGKNLTKIQHAAKFFFDKVKNEKSYFRFLAKPGFETALSAIKKKTRTIDTIMKLYRPFIYDYNYIFQSENLLFHEIIEEEFHYTPQKINWPNYWQETHIPGLHQWCLPQFKTEGEYKKS
jgi:nucleoside-diphosphate-sugar epimerase